MEEFRIPGVKHYRHEVSICWILIFRSYPRLWNWYLLFLCYLARSIKEKEQRLVGSDSGENCLPMDSCFHELALLKFNSACWFCTKWTSLSSHWINLFSPWYSWNITHLTLNNLRSLTHLTWSNIRKFVLWTSLYCYSNFSLWCTLYRPIIWIYSFYVLL